MALLDIDYAEIGRMLTVETPEGNRALEVCKVIGQTPGDSAVGADDAVGASCVDLREVHFLYHEGTKTTKQGSKPYPCLGRKIGVADLALLFANLNLSCSSCLRGSIKPRPGP